MASPDDGPILFIWFNWLPIVADQWLLPEGVWMATALDVAVLALQYLAPCVLYVLAYPLLKVAADFLRRSRHRNGLVR
jgi:hypothetical protein